jgi:hypothetical protein
LKPPKTAARVIGLTGALAPHQAAEELLVSAGIFQT